MKTQALVVKVASRCNLNCTYCYMYNMGDDSYKLQPKFMSDLVVESIFLRIKNHSIINNLERFLIVFHGGEPLLTGIDFYENFVSIGQKVIGNQVKIDYTMQSNGVLITEKIAKKLKELNIQIGISLDGTPKSNDENRVYHNGKGSYKEILKGYNIIRDIYGSDYANCLSVIDTNDDPRIVYQHFKEIKVSSVHFLFQDFNYLQNTQDNIPKIGNWLIEMFNLWYYDTEENKPSIRPLTDLISLMFDLNKSTEIFGKGYNDVLTIETDGSIETVDTLRICGNNFNKTNFNVLKDELSTIYENSEIASLYYNAHNSLCETCLNCPIESICGGGFLGHRYSNEKKFDNPSIYCKEIIILISHIQNEMIKNMPEDIIKDLDVEKLNPLEIINSLYNAY